MKALIALGLLFSLAACDDDRPPREPPLAPENHSDNGVTQDEVSPD